MQCEAVWSVPELPFPMAPVARGSCRPDSWLWLWLLLPLKWCELGVENGERDISDSAK